MSSAISIRAVGDTVREVPSGILGVAYTQVGASFTHPTRIVIFQNYTDTGVMFSTNGVNDWLPLTPNGYLVLDVASNKTSTQGFSFPEGATFYVRQLGAPATTGSVYISTVYGASI